MRRSICVNIMTCHLNIKKIVHLTISHYCSLMFYRKLYGFFFMFWIFLNILVHLCREFYDGNWYLLTVQRLVFIFFGIVMNGYRYYVICALCTYVIFESPGRFLNLIIRELNSLTFRKKSVDLHSKQYIYIYDVFE